MTELVITKQYLREHPNEIFVFGDNLERVGYGGAAILRDEPNTYGFITKKAPTHDLKDFYKPDEYEPIFYAELRKLLKIILDNRDKTFLISRIGAGLANEFEIWEKIIEPKLKKLLGPYKNVKFLWSDEPEKTYLIYEDDKGILTVNEVADDEDYNLKLDVLKAGGLLLKYYLPIKATSEHEAIKTFRNLYSANDTD